MTYPSDPHILYENKQYHVEFRPYFEGTGYGYEYERFTFPTLGEASAFLEGIEVRDRYVKVEIKNFRTDT